MLNIGILGAGTWGLALAKLLNDNGHNVTCWSPIENEIDTLKQSRAVARLCGMHLPESILLTTSMEAAVSSKGIIVCAVPSPYIRATFEKAAPYIDKSQIIVDVSKGFENQTLLPLSEVIADTLQKSGKQAAGIVALTGPTHAEEVAQNLPTTIVAACEDEQVAKRVQDAFMSPVFRVYTNADHKGAELCGALKNVMAIAVGIALGLGYGDNTKAALMTRGMAEITRLGLQMKCDASTFYGLCGMGDLIVTCTSIHSRNLKFGHLLGQGKTTKEALIEVGMVVEGLNALDAAVALSARYNVEMPIVQATYDIIRKGANPKDAVANLMTRERKSE